MTKITMITAILIFLSLSTTIPKQPFNPYHELGVTQSSSKQQIKKAFKELSKKYHPDRQPNDPNHKQRYHKIIQAYELIKKQWYQQNQFIFHRSHDEGKDYINIDDLLNQMQWEQYEHQYQHTNTHTQKTKPKAFVPWCIDNPQIVLAAFCISIGILLSCK